MTESANGLLTKGNGPAVLFQHGTFMDATMFEPQLDYLSANGWRGVAYNSRALTHRDESHTLEDLADDCRALANELKLDKFVLCGMSVGALMAIEFALKYPDRLLGLIMIDGKAAAYGEDERRMLVPRFEALNIDGAIPLEFAHWVAPLCFGETSCRVNRPLVDHWINRWITEIPARSVYRQYQSWLNKPDRHDVLAKIDVPVLLFHGGEDVPTPFHHSLGMIEKLQDATLVKVPRSGHTSNLEQPEIVNAAIGAFLSRVSPADR